MKGLQPGSYFYGVSWIFPAAAAAIAADYLPSGLMRLGLFRHAVLRAYAMPFLSPWPCHLVGFTFTRTTHAACTNRTRR